MRNKAAKSWMRNEVSEHDYNINEMRRFKNIASVIASTQGKITDFWSNFVKRDIYEIF